MTEEDWESLVVLVAAGLVLFQLKSQTLLIVYFML